MKKILLSVGLVSLCTWSYAKHVNLEDATTVAQNFISTKTAEKNTSLNLIKSYGGQAPLVYVFSYNQDKGFVIVSGDDVVVPILGYSLENAYPNTNISPEVTYMMNSYVSQIEYIKEYNRSASEEVRVQWEALQTVSGKTANRGTAVAPILATKWNQLPYYNLLCPIVPSGSSRAPAGCVATAMAQVMKYWDNPTTGTGSRTYSSSSLGGTLTANFGTTTYDWANMPVKLLAGSSSVEKNAVAKLMYHCGVAVKMNYNTNASGAYVISYGNAGRACSENALKNNFGYKNTIVGYPRTSFQDTTWIKMLKFEIDNERPLIYTGYGQVGGHAFVFDGYDDNDMFHINWGWGGMSDGYFIINNLSPSALGAGGGGGNFNYGQEALIMIEPDGSILPPNPFSPDFIGADFQLVLNDEPASSADTIYYGGAYNVTANIKNLGTEIFSNSNIIALVAYDTNIANGTVVRTRAVNILPDSTFNFSYGTPSFSTLQPGVYYLVMLFEDQAGSEVIENPNGGNAVMLTVLPKKPTGIDELLDDGAISVFPNPAQAHINIKLENSDNSIKSINITDIQGRVIFQKENISTDNLQILTSSYAEGTYLINIQTEKGNFSKKITIIK